MKNFNLRPKLTFLLAIAILAAGGLLINYINQSIEQKSLDERIRRDNPVPRLPFSNTEIPRTISGATSDKIAKTSSGQEYVRDELNVNLEQDTPDPDKRIKEIADDTNATIIGSIPETLSYQLQYNVSSFEELKKIEFELEKLSNVETVTISWIMHVQPF